MLGDDGGTRRNELARERAARKANRQATPGVVVYAGLAGPSYADTDQAEAAVRAALLATARGVGR
jgi:hypothetical protein